MLTKLTITLAVGLIVLADYSNAFKLDVLSSGNRRREFYDTACEENGGPRNPLDISNCQRFVCNDGTEQPIQQGTPCKIVLNINYGHCLDGTCLSTAEYLQQTENSSSPSETNEANST